MYRFRSAKLVAAAVAEVESEAIRSWHREHSRRHSLDEALAADVKGIRTIVDRLQQGNVLVTIHVSARKDWLDDTYMFRLQIDGNSVLRVEPKV